MGSSFDTWDNIVANGGAYYPGVGSMEVVWVLITIAICVVSLWVGHKHEADAYKRINGGS